MDELMALAEPPTAVICVRDAPALAVLDWMQHKNLAPGRDLSVIGSGDGAYRERRYGKLSSIRVHFRRMGEVAALEALCAARTAQMRTIIVVNRLKLRGTVGPPRPTLDAGRSTSV
jgi:DNA-binding LacI/PurR family transcriptional regulator